MKHHIMKKFGKQVTLKDIQNVRSKISAKEKGVRNDAQVLCDHMNELLQKDAGAKGGILVNDDDQLSAVYFASSHLCQLYEKFPEVMMIDGTYNVNSSRMPLYSFMIEDGYGHGRTVFYAAISEESSQYISAIAKAFKSCNPSFSKTKVIIIDKDFIEIKVIKEEFPEVNILFCQFHVIKHSV